MPEQPWKDLVRCVGVDIASIGLSAVALAVNGEPKQALVWKPVDKRESEAAHLVQFESWFRFKLAQFKADIVVVESLAVFLNKKVIMALAKREGVALLVAKKSGAIVVNPTVGQSRSIVLGKAGKKEDAFRDFKRQYPTFKLLPSNVGGMDQADAAVHALAGPDLLERR